MRSRLPTIDRVKAETYAIYLAYKDPRTPWYAKLLAAGVVAYAISPIDLVPDFIPVLGALDDLIIVPLAMSLALKMIPREVMTECRAKAYAVMARREDKRTKWIVAGIVIAVWILLAALTALVILRVVEGRVESAVGFTG